MKNLFTLAVLSATLLMFMPGCKKQKNAAQPEKTTTYYFWYAGTMREGEPIGFSVKAPDTAKCLWDFGDGATASYINTTHTYTRSGVYNVTVIVNGDVAHKESKTVSVNANSFPAYLASGVKTWHGHETINTRTGNSSRDLSDSSFAILYVDSSDVRVYNQVLPYNKNSSSGDVSVFARAIDGFTRYSLTCNTKSGTAILEIIFSTSDYYSQTLYTAP